MKEIEYTASLLIKPVSRLVDPLSGTGHHVGFFQKSVQSLRAESPGGLIRK